MNFISEMNGEQQMMFSHDGLRDSLTYLAAPPYFYESLRRELAAAERNKTRLALIRFQLLPNIPENESLYEAAILAFAELLKGATRSEDLCARLGRFEFTMIVGAQSEIAGAIAERVQRSWSETNFLCQAHVVSASGKESPLEILNRLDGAPALTWS
jgi:GGDEF domain-containing protein